MRVFLLKCFVANVVNTGACIKRNFITLYTHYTYIKSLSHTRIQVLQTFENYKYTVTS